MFFILIWFICGLVGLLLATEWFRVVHGDEYRTILRSGWWIIPSGIAALLGTLWFLFEKGRICRYFRERA